MCSWGLEQVLGSAGCDPAQHRRAQPCPQDPGSVSHRSGGCLLQQRQESFPGLAGRQRSAAGEVGSAVFAVKCRTFNLSGAECVHPADGWPGVCV